MKKPRFNIIQFAGTNCDRDTFRAVTDVAGGTATYVFHKEMRMPAADVVILPGGFSYGDYLRSGAIARFSPIMREVVRFAQAGGVVVGICNGFQVLLEAGLLKGAMIRNTSGVFVCRTVNVSVERRDTALTREVPKDKPFLRIPIAHADGNFQPPPKVLEELESKGLVLFRYVDEQGNATPGANPNGSAKNIAGIMNEAGNVFGLMPHPERADEHVLGSEDGRWLLESIIRSV